MYTVNTSFFVEPPVHERWLDLMKSKYIPFLADNGHRDVRLYRVIHEGVQPGGFTYALMVACPDTDAYRRITGELFDEYKTISGPLFGDAVQWFTTLLKES